MFRQYVSHCPAPGTQINLEVAIFTFFYHQYFGGNGELRPIITLDFLFGYLENFAARNEEKFVGRELIFDIAALVFSSFRYVVLRSFFEGEIWYLFI